MLSQKLDNIIYAVSTSKEVSKEFKAALMPNLKSCRDTARAMEEKLIIDISKETTDVQILAENAGVPSAA